MFDADDCKQCHCSTCERRKRITDLWDVLLPAVTVTVLLPLGGYVVAKLFGW